MELKHGEWEEHKYIAKVPVGKNWRYFYEKDEYQAYLNSKKQPIEMGGIIDTVKNMIDSHKTYAEGLGDCKSFSELKKKLEHMPWSRQDDLSIINRNWYSGHYSYQYNCAYCTAAYDMRRRGYDVVADARTKFDDITYTSELASWYKGSIIQTFSPETEAFYLSEGSNVELNRSLISLQEKLHEAGNPFDSLNARLDLIDAEMMLTKELKQYGEGARGFLSIEWNNGGGHAIAWEILNGRLMLLDGQINATYTDTRESYINEDTGQKCEMSGIQTLLMNVKSIEYFRTDHLEPTNDILKVIKNRK